MIMASPFSVSPRLSEVKPTRCVCCCVTLLHTYFLLWRASATPAAQPTTWWKSSEMWVDVNAPAHGSHLWPLPSARPKPNPPERSYSSERNSLFGGGSTEAARPEGLVRAGLSSWGWSRIPPRLHSGPLPHGSGQRHLTSWWDQAPLPNIFSIGYYTCIFISLYSSPEEEE